MKVTPVLALDRDQVNSSVEDKKVIIGSKVFTENILLAEMLSLILEEKYKLQVVRRFKMGGTQMLFDALKQESIYIYPEYTGTAYIMLFKLDGKNSPDFIYKKVKNAFLKKFNISWSLPLGFENAIFWLLERKTSDLKTFITQVKFKPYQIH